MECVKQHSGKRNWNALSSDLIYADAGSSQKVFPQKDAKAMTTGSPGIRLIPRSTSVCSHPLKNLFWIFLHLGNDMQMSASGMLCFENMHVMEKESIF